MYIFDDAYVVGTGTGTNRNNLKSARHPKSGNGTAFWPASRGCIDAVTLHRDIAPKDSYDEEGIDVRHLSIYSLH